MQILLETERLILRRFTAEDADHLFHLDNDPEVMRFINGGTPVSRETIQNDILPSFLNYDDRFPDYGFWAVCEKATGDFLGWFSFRPRDHSPNEVGLGYRFKRNAWGKGYATEGAQALIRKGFTELEVQRILATTYEENLASRRVMEKVGMTFRRVFRITAEDILASDTFHATDVELWPGDDVEYVLDKADWDGQNKRG